MQSAHQLSTKLGSRRRTATSQRPVKQKATTIELIARTCRISKVFASYPRGTSRTRPRMLSTHGGDVGADQLDAFLVDQGAAEFGHHDPGLDGPHAVQQDGAVGVARGDGDLEAA